ncbi:MAG: bifunctional phosphoribosyl-AMP cyclohydrolase/phosphoribosyl-ATP diphosphatase HisIE [Clostridia bacterium]|nr:bifunctional phosphoribosyl-AMP cyclohydrolase/phosphoribosyl-ATP diphosphatase HisIE [Clostridia bacterium]
MIDIDELKFNHHGLIPAIVVDAKTKKVLTLAYMNKESLQISIEKELTCFWSRSRQELWLKGETSGNYQHIVSITADCDKDALVVMVEPDGPACHLGTTSCFENKVYESENRHEFSLEGLMDMLVGRKIEKKEGSYTTYLFEKGRDKILKKVGEESTEVIIAGKADDKKETIYEIADLAYHVMVLMIDMGISLEDIFDELASRHVIDKKDKQEKMVRFKKRQPKQTIKTI